MRVLPTIALLLWACAPAPTGPGSSAGGSGGNGGSSTGGSSPQGCASGSCSVGSVCNPAQDVDPCAAQGLACSPDYTNASPTGAFCELPGQYFDCLPSVGCASANLQCVGADDAGDPGGCLEPCTTTAECWDPLTVCTAAQTGSPTYCLANGCNDFWQACSASSAAGNDGTCIYLYDDPQYGPQGACLQGGSVPSGGACNYYRADGGLLCSPGTLCMIDANADNAGICMPVCDAVADGGPSCAGDCIAQEPPAPPPAVSALDFDQAGACATPCNSQAPDCPPLLTCYELGASGTTAACLP